MKTNTLPVWPALANAGLLVLLGLALGGLVRTHRNDHCASSEWLDVDRVGLAVSALLQDSDGNAPVLHLDAGGALQAVTEHLITN